MAYTPGQIVPMSLVGLKISRDGHKARGVRGNIDSYCGDRHVGRPGNYSGGHCNSRPRAVSCCGSYCRLVSIWCLDLGLISNRRAGCLLPPPCYVLPYCAALYHDAVVGAFVGVTMGAVVGASIICAGRASVFFRRRMACCFSTMSK